MTSATQPRSSLTLGGLIRTRLEESRDALGVQTIVPLLDLSGMEAIPGWPILGAMPVMDVFDPPIDEDDDEVVLQRHVATVAVVAGVQAINDGGGWKGTTEAALTSLINATRRTLLGWSPEGENVGRMLVRADRTVASILGPSAEERESDAARWRPLMLLEGQLVNRQLRPLWEGAETGRQEAKAVMWWADTYVTSRMARGIEPSPCTMEVPTTPYVRMGSEEPVALVEVDA